MPARITTIVCTVFLAVCFLHCSRNAASAPATADTVAALPHPDHIIFVWFENKGYDGIVGNADAPYMNSLLARGTLFTNMNGVTHPSYPNYVDFFAGQENGVASDSCIHGAALSTPNLYTALKSGGKSFAWYSEDLPATGSTTCYYDYYVEKHNPTTIFSNVSKNANKRFEDLPADYNRLENVLCISPNVMHDMHDGTVAQADTWLKNSLAPLVDWCTGHNSIFVIYFDEGETTTSNEIPVIAVGQNVKANYRLETMLDHFNWTRTICSMFNAPNAWTNNLSARQEITKCWK